MGTFNIGIMGAGHIARKMANTLNKMSFVGEDVKAYAIASRNLEKAQAFASEFDIPVAYGSYDQMLEDKAIDLVYIATPNSCHYDHILMCIQAGKPVLCEKSFTLTAKEAETVLALAKEKGIFVAEAIWTRYMPSRKIINDIIASGAIGKVHTISANLGYPVSWKERLTDLNLGGGALLDLGVYVLNFAAMFVDQDPLRIDSSCEMWPTGVDAQESITLVYPDNKMAILHSSMISRTDRQGVISGEIGNIVVNNVNNPDYIKVYGDNYILLSEQPINHEFTGFEYQVRACRDAITNGKIEVPEMPHSEIIRMMSQMDYLRHQWGMKFSNE